MRPVAELLNEEGFLKTMFESIPCGMMIVDSDRRIQALNNVMEHGFNVCMSEAIDSRAGGLIGCMLASEGPKVCGSGENCQGCGIWNTCLEALSGGQAYRNKAKIQVLVDGIPRELTILVSAAPIEYDGERLVIIILEDITELNTLRNLLKKEKGFAGIIGRDPKIKELFHVIQEVTDANLPVLIQGESGTGKELVACAIHEEGIRANKPFVPVNCAAIPDGLLESELFGHVKGAFTGAVRDKLGKFELAHGGTLFLDEVAELPKMLQAKLLRVLQEGTFERVGGEKSISVNVSLVSATNCNLKREVESANFREDLYYRISVIPIFTPPLRELKNDIPLLVEHFLEKSREEGQDSAGVSFEALSVMAEFNWPGNVRQLQSTIRFAAVKSGGRTILPEHLPAEMKTWKTTQILPGPSRKLNYESVRSALIQSGGNKAKTARVLGVGRATLYRFLDMSPDVSRDISVSQ